MNRQQSLQVGSCTCHPSLGCKRLYACSSTTNDMVVGQFYCRSGVLAGQQIHQSLLQSVAKLDSVPGCAHCITCMPQGYVMFAGACTPSPRSLSFLFLHITSNASVSVSTEMQTDLHPHVDRYRPQSFPKGAFRSDTDLTLCCRGDKTASTRAGHLEHIPATCRPWKARGAIWPSHQGKLGVQCCCHRHCQATTPLPHLQVHTLCKSNLASSYCSLLLLSVCLSVCLSISVSACLLFCMSNHLFVCLFVCPSDHPSKHGF